VTKWCVPPILGVAGAVMASRDRRLGDQGRVLWSVASAFGGLAEVFLAFVLVTLIAGPQACSISAHGDADDVGPLEGRERAGAEHRRAVAAGGVERRVPGR